MEMVDKDVELIEWPDDISKMKCGRKKRFENLDDVKKYMDYHTSEEINDNKKFREVIHKDKDTCSKLLYSKGYVIPHEWLNEHDCVGDENPLNTLYGMRRSCLRARCTKRRKLYRELNRWKVRLQKVNLKLDKRLIINLSEVDVEEREHITSVVLRWLCRSVGIEEVYMYNGLRGRIGYRYYSGESVIVIFVENKRDDIEEYEMDRKQLYRIRRVLRKEEVTRCGYKCDLHDKWIVVLDSTGQVTCEKYGVLTLTYMSGQEIIDALKAYNHENEILNQFTT